MTTPRRSLRPTEVVTRLSALPGWTLSGDGSDVAIARTFRFAGWHQTIAFVNAVAWLAQQRDHHPRLVVGFDSCEVLWNTHDPAGLTEADFDCAARVDALLEP